MKFGSVLQRLSTEMRLGWTGPEKHILRSFPARTKPVKDHAYNSLEQQKNMAVKEC